MQVSRRSAQDVGISAQIGVYGLATMGANFARNLAGHGFRVAVFNRHTERTDRFMLRHGHEGAFCPATDLEAFANALEQPRSIVLMVEAGAAVDAIVEQLLPLLDPGDIIVDAGNSHFADTERRQTATAAQGIRFVGMGMSGGERGALAGPSLMPGGDQKAYDHLAPILTRVAAKAEGEPCCAYVGPGSAGHYVKMIHNGIEYADMQGIAECYALIRTALKLPADEIAGIFDQWRAGDLASYLLDVTVDVLRHTDSVGQPLVDLVVDEAAQKGTGLWTAREALALGAASSSIMEAVHARLLSSQRDLRQRSASALGSVVPVDEIIDPPALDDLHDALLGARIVAFSQGFDQLAAASEEYDWDLDLAAIARVWRGGCIIRARILDHIVEDRKVGGGSPLLFEPWFAETLRIVEQGWRRTAHFALARGIPAPVLTSALSYYDGIRQQRSPANLIQAMRDEFGAHGYKRYDRDGTFHTEWSTPDAANDDR